MLYGVNVSGVRITGGGAISGGAGGLHTGVTEPGFRGMPEGDADKMVAVVSSSDITLSNLTLSETGHFAILMTDVAGAQISDLTIHPTRDGIDLVGVRDALCERLFIRGGGDDAFVIKSDFSVGRFVNSERITVRDSDISTVGATALEIGSETAGNFSSIVFENIAVHSAGDAGIGIVAMDGGHVSDVLYKNITMDNLTLAEWQALDPTVNDVGSTYKNVPVRTQAAEIIAAARKLLSLPAEA